MQLAKVIYYCESSFKKVWEVKALLSEFSSSLTLKWYTKGFPFHENIYCIISFKVKVFSWSIFLCFPKWINMQGLIKVQKLFINLIYGRYQSKCTLLMWHNLLIHLDKKPRNPQYLHHLGLGYCFPNMAVLLPLAIFAAIVSLVSKWNINP